MTIRILAASVAFAVGAATMVAGPTFAAAKKSAYEIKKAQCEREAKAKNFGIHFIKRNRWIKDCIAKP